jgi:hypothetical protein
MRTAKDGQAGQNRNRWCNVSNSDDTVNDKITTRRRGCLFFVPSLYVLKLIASGKDMPYYTVNDQIGKKRTGYMLEICRQIHDLIMKMSIRFNILEAITLCKLKPSVSHYREKEEPVTKHIL